MWIMLTRTVIFFVALNVIMRFLGKRQMGEMQISEFITSIMISELAVLPITNPAVPISQGLAGLALLAVLEFISSYLSRKSPRARRVLDGRPLILIAKGKVIEKNLTRSRISTEELFAAIRTEGYRGIEEVEYVILEQTGALSVVPVGGGGVSHTVILDGTVQDRALAAAGKDIKWLYALLAKKKLTVKELLYLTVNDGGEIHFEKRSGN